LVRLTPFVDPVTGKLSKPEALSIYPARLVVTPEAEAACKCD